MTPNLQLYNKAYETLQGYGFPVISRKEMQQEIPYPFVIKCRSQTEVNTRLIVILVTRI